MTDIDNHPRVIKLREFQARADQHAATSGRLFRASIVTGVVAVAAAAGYAVTDWWWLLSGAVPWVAVLARQVWALRVWGRHLTAWERELDAARAELDAGPLGRRP